MADQKTAKPSMTAAEATALVSRAMLSKAVEDAAAAVAKMGVQPSYARRYAHAALQAGGDGIRSENAIRLSGVNVQEMVATVGLAVTALLIDLAVLGTVAARGPRGVRRAALVAAAAHVAVVVAGRRLRKRTQKNITEGLAAGLAAAAKMPPKPGSR